MLRPSDMHTYYWDFFGPRAAGTAEHFKKHLLQFLEQNALAGCTVDTVSEAEGHEATRCIAPEGAWAAIERSLRPQRRI